MNVEQGLNIHSFDGFIDISQSEQIIIFVNTRRKAEDLALKISEFLPPSGDITKWIEKIDALVESTPSTRKLKKMYDQWSCVSSCGITT